MEISSSFLGKILFEASTNIQTHNKNSRFSTQGLKLDYFFGSSFIYKKTIPNCGFYNLSIPQKCYCGKNGMLYPLFDIIIAPVFATVLKNISSFKM